MQSKLKCNLTLSGRNVKKHKNTTKVIIIRIWKIGGYITNETCAQHKIKYIMTYNLTPTHVANINLLSFLYSCTQSFLKVDVTSSIKNNALL